MATQVKDKSEGTMVGGQRGGLIVGMVLICLGVVGLAGQIMGGDVFGQLILPGLGVLFLAWGISVRNVAFMIPGGILSGIGLGVILIEGPLGDIAGQAEGGVFMLCFALGWGLVAVLGTIFTDESHWWALIPGGIIGVIGGGMLVGDSFFEVLARVSVFWPAVLVVVGLALIVRRTSGSVSD